MRIVLKSDACELVTRAAFLGCFTAAFVGCEQPGVDGDHVEADAVGVEGGASGQVALSEGGMGGLPSTSTGDAGVDADEAFAGTPTCSNSSWMPITSWQGSAASGTVMSIGAGPTAGSEDVAMATGAGEVAHVVVTLGGLPLPFAVGDVLETSLVRSPGFQFGLTLTVTRDNQTVLYLATAEDSFAASPVSLGLGGALCAIVDPCGLRKPSTLLASGGTTTVTLGPGQVGDVGAFRVLNDGTENDVSSGKCSDFSGAFFHVAIVRVMP